MQAKPLGSIRRSSLISTYGVGALLPIGEDSVMIAGIDEWPKGDVLLEPRLAASLGVDEFRNPPTWRGRRGDIPAVRFPIWSFCPGCRRLGPFWEIADDDRRCKECAETVSPSRFVSCCVDGHIEDFPYRAWVHKDASTGHDGHRLWLRPQGHTSALADLMVVCQCGEKRSMAGSFDFAAMRGIRKCGGLRPWLLNSEKVNCSNELRTLQRGSSNVWFAVTRSALSIPAIARKADRFALERFRDADLEMTAEELARIYPPPGGCTREDIAQAIIRMRTPAASREKPSDRELRAEEYQALVNGLDLPETRDQFLSEEMDLDDSDVPGQVAQLSRVGRLREVRALTGFTRVLPTSSEQQDVNSAPLSLAAPRWLPAIEVLGEGVFVRLDEDRLSTWARSEFAASRARLILAAQPDLDDPPERIARSLVLHSLAHMLIDEMSLTSGYPAASIRERVYDDEGQTGVLVFTATADSAGSLGGLAAQSDPGRFTRILHSAVERARWCTTDPVCIESPASGVNGSNLAACHACLLVPEPSCERFNLGLDRAVIVGSPDRTGEGFLSDL